jgi:hypothetical protein
MPDQPQPRAPQTIDLGRVVGHDGTPATITGATAVTGAPGTNAQVSMGGTPSARTFQFTIPRGDVGVPGSTGDALQYPPTYPITYVGGTTQANVATIPGFTYTAADYNKVLFLYGRLHPNPNGQYLLNINSLGNRQIVNATPNPYGDWGQHSSWPWWNLERWPRPNGMYAAYPTHGEYNSQPFTLMVRFNGSYFEERRLGEVYRDILRLHSGKTNFWHWMTSLVAGGTRLISAHPNMDTPLIPHTIAGICTISFDARTKLQGWNLVRPDMLHRKRRLIIKHAWSVPASTIRIPNFENTISWYDDSESKRTGTYIHTRQTVPFGYDVRVAKHLIDGGYATVGAGYVDIPYPGGATEMEIVYSANYPTFDYWKGGLYKHVYAPPNLRASRWGPMKILIDILDVTIMQRV